MDTGKFVISSLVLGLITCWVLWIMLRSWRRRNTRDASLAPVGGTLEGTEIARFDRVFYVSTTPAESPLERIAIPGLAYRGWASVRIASDGVEIAVRGETPVTIAAGEIAGHTTAQLTIDKVVERDGLARIEWESARGLLATVLRFGDHGAHQQFALGIETMLGTQPFATSQTLKES